MARKTNKNEEGALMEQELMYEDEMDAPKTKSKAVSVLDLPGVGATTAEKLASVGYDDLMSIAVASPSEIMDVTGMSEAVAHKLIQASRESLDMGFSSGEDLLAKRRRVMKISTGVKDFDRILGGGFETGCISECFGQYGSAKTQIAHQLAVNVYAEDPTAVTVFIDTENTFRPERIIQFATGKNVEGDEVLKNIRVARAYNSDHQMLLVDKVEELIKGGLNVKLIVVDSLTAHFRAEFVGRSTLAERQQKLNKHMHALSRLGDMFNCAIYVTNQVMAKPDAFFGDPTEAIGGHIVGHNSTFRIYLRRGKKGTRVAKLIDAPNLPDDEAVFIVTEAGLTDA